MTTAGNKNSGAMPRWLCAPIEKLAAGRKAFGAFRASPAVRRFADFFYSPLFIYAVGLITFAFNMIGVDEITYTLLALVGAAALVFSPDMLPAFAVIVFFTVARSMGNRDFEKFTSVSYVVLAIDGVIAGASCVFHLLMNFSPRAFRGSRLVLGFVFLGAGLLVNGFLSDSYVWKNVASGIKLIAYMFGVYFLARSCIRPTKNTLRYFAHVCLIYGLVVAAQVCGMYLFNRAFIESGYSKSAMIFGWGISNTAGEVLFRCVPFCFYLICTEEKHVWYYFLAAVLISVAQVFTVARASLLFNIPIFLLCYVLCCVLGKRRKQTLICGGVAVLATLLAIICLRGQLETLFRHFINAGMNDSGRFRLWDEGFGYFRKYPVFGVGLRYKYGESFHHFTYYHNTLIQYTVAGGIVGIGTYLFHRMQTVAMFTQKLTLDRLFLGILFGGILGISLLDNFVMYLSTQLFMGFVLALSERDLEKTLPFAYRKRGKKYKRLY